YPYNGQLGGLDAAPQLAKMALDEFPSAARGDAHRLVVISRRTAGSKRVTKPEPVLLRDRIGEIGEGRSPLIGSDDQIGIIAVQASDLRRRHDTMPSRTVDDDIVGKIEQSSDQSFVAFNRFILELITRGGGPLDDKAAF